MEIQYINQTDEDISKYEELISKLLEGKSEGMNINYIFVSEEEIQSINRDYRNIDKVTDVISFANIDSDIIEGAEEDLGDVFICLKRAYEQAVDYNHSNEREVGFLAVHGYLHLLGYDHNTEEEEKEMFGLQEEILLSCKLERGI